MLCAMLCSKYIVLDFFFLFTFASFLVLLFFYGFCMVTFQYMGKCVKLIIIVFISNVSRGNTCV